MYLRTAALQGGHVAGIIAVILKLFPADVHLVLLEGVASRSYQRGPFTSVSCNMSTWFIGAIINVVCPTAWSNQRYHGCQHNSQGTQVA